MGVGVSARRGGILACATAPCDDTYARAMQPTDPSPACAPRPRVLAPRASSRQQASGAGPGTLEALRSETRVRARGPCSGARG